MENEGESNQIPNNNDQNEGQSEKKKNQDQGEGECNSNDNINGGDIIKFKRKKSIEWINECSCVVKFHDAIKHQQLKRM